ncbi:hypothetical protein [Verminephrobacter aporrectodeae]|uniref:hypothetical protein n=1 Tax=Verminephrobacter aporrectodeae TaxID=1110389 RepID=UPI000594F1BE|nr:hypothetical protein [Verminephrobacter aporrectodeae]
MKRFRWFHVEWPTSIRTLAKRIHLYTFEGESGHGFFIDRVRDDYLEARYVERIEYTDVVVDPFGKELTFERVEFRQTLFRASSTAPGLELIDPPRNVQALMNRLSETMDFEIAITPAVVDVLLWSEVLQNVGGISSVVDSLQIGALEIEPGIVAKVVVKGDRDVRASCTALTQARKFATEKIQLRLASPHRGTVVLSLGGSAALSSEDSIEHLMQPLRTALANAMRAPKR